MLVTHIFLRNRSAFQCIWSNVLQFSWFHQNKIFSVRYWVILHRFSKWLMLISDAVSWMLIFWLSQILWWSCYLTTAHVTLDDPPERATLTTAVRPVSNLFTFLCLILSSFFGKFHYFPVSGHKIISAVVVVSVNGAAILGVSQEAQRQWKPTRSNWGKVQFVYVTIFNSWQHYFWNKIKLSSLFDSPLISYTLQNLRF
jgi:hypothetical protein